jgi:hypothetical protein
MRLSLWRCQQRQPHHVALLRFLASVKGLCGSHSMSQRGSLCSPMHCPAGLAAQMPSGQHIGSPLVRCPSASLFSNPIWLEFTALPLLISAHGRSKTTSSKGIRKVHRATEAQIQIPAARFSEGWENFFGLKRYREGYRASDISKFVGDANANS